jgi:triosephosphate isomerase
MTRDHARRPLIAGNWKLWGTRAQAADYCARLAPLLPGDDARNAMIGICPVYTALEVCTAALEGSGVKVYAQNMHHEQTGAFTGEISAEMLTELGVDGVVLGHSERREYNCETDRALQEKVPVALGAGLEPILCVGESEEERERDETQRKLRTQVQEALEQVPDDRLADVVIAYEPIWAIGTGKVATPEIAQEAIAFIRALVGDRSKDAAERIRILYGGSVKPDNAREILAQPDVDGALVGGASLDPKGLVEIASAVPSP